MYFYAVVQSNSFQKSFHHQITDVGGGVHRLPEDVYLLLVVFLRRLSQVVFSPETFHPHGTSSQTDISELFRITKWIFLNNFLFMTISASSSVISVIKVTTAAGRGISGAVGQLLQSLTPTACYLCYLICPGAQWNHYLSGPRLTVITGGFVCENMSWTSY